MERASIAGCEGLYAEDWRRRGIVHGFLDRGLSMRNPTDFALFENSVNTSLLLLEQVHGNDFQVLSSELEERPIADAWISDMAQLRERSIGIITADCAPVLMLAPQISTVSALHCGWRSTVDLLVPKVVDALCRLGASVDEIEVLLGPAAGECCYEIGADVAGRIIEASSAGDAVLVPADNQKFFCDIRRLIQAQLDQLGVDPQKVRRNNSCTICNPQYFSHRREKALSGRQLTFIGPVVV